MAEQYAFFFFVSAMDQFQFLEEIAKLVRLIWTGRMQ